MRCQCPQPRERSYQPGSCHCGKTLDPKWVSSDTNMTKYLSRVASLPGVYSGAITHAQERERAGRQQFGFSYLARNNPAEAQEESADGVIYTALQWLCDRRDGIEEVDPDLLDAAHHFALAHAALQRRRDRTE